MTKNKDLKTVLIPSFLIGGVFGIGSFFLFEKIWISIFLFILIFIFVLLFWSIFTNSSKADYNADKNFDTNLRNSNTRSWYYLSRSK